MGVRGSHGLSSFPLLRFLLNCQPISGAWCPRLLQGASCSHYCPCVPCLLVAGKLKGRELTVHSTHAYVAGTALDGTPAVCRTWPSVASDTLLQDHRARRCCEGQGRVRHGLRSTWHGRTHIPVRCAPAMGAAEGPEPGFSLPEGPEHQGVNMRRPGHKAGAPFAPCFGLSTRLTRVPLTRCVFLDRPRHRAPPAALSAL